MNPIAAAVLALIFVLSPAKPYVKPDEPMAVRFASAESKTTVPNAESLLAKFGPAAVDIAGLFNKAAAEDLVDAAGKPLFQVYTFDGKPLDPQAVAKPDLTKATIDIAAYYPQLRERGTYILTWKTAQPLVIETLGPAIPWGFLIDKDRNAQKQAYYQQLQKTPPVITHIVPLTYALISTDKGDIKATFDYAAAPHTVDAFTGLAQEGYYDNSAFHRIIKGFMIQGGDSVTGDRAGSGGPGFNQAAELSDKPHVRGVLSMARTGVDVNTAGGQFFIIHGKADHLNGQYTAFGQVINGMDIVDKIVETPVTDANGSTKPEDRPKIKSITILPATVDMYNIKVK